MKKLVVYDTVLNTVDSLYYRQYLHIRARHANACIQRIKSRKDKDRLVGIYSYTYSNFGIDCAVLCNKIYTRAEYDKLVSMFNCDFRNCKFYTIYGDKL